MGESEKVRGGEDKRQRAEGKGAKNKDEHRTSNVEHPTSNNRMGNDEKREREKGRGETTEGETRRAGDGEKEKIKDEHRTLNAQHRTSNKMKGAWKIDTEKANDGGGEEERGKERVEH